MDFAVLSLFPGMFEGFFSLGVFGQAVESGLIRATAIDIRDFAQGRHRTADDRPFGGGSGMVMKPEPLSGAVTAAKELLPEAPVVLLSPQGRVFTQKIARQMLLMPGVILVCGRYEGLDERFIEKYVDLEVSVGDYVLSGGEPAAMVVMDAVARLVPGVLGNDQSAVTESFETGLLENAHYTRPRDFSGDNAPDVLFSGHHRLVENWRRESALLRTLARRPDLLEGRRITKEEFAALFLWRERIDHLIAAQALPGPGPSPGEEQVR